MPTVLQAAIYASALPCVVHDLMLFVSGTDFELLGDWLWRIVLELVQEGTRSPKLADIQASLLYLQRLPPRQPRKPSNISSWTSFLASTVAMAVSLGLHLEPRPWGIPAWEKRLRRRLWWAVYLEDKRTSLLLGRPPLIRPDEWDVVDLDETDFEDGDLTNANSITSYESLIIPHFTKLGRLVESVHQIF
jgi:hypothetical protein